jgi:hypothetical protein
VAAEWREAYQNQDFNIMSVTCDGCTSTSGRLSSYCSVCEVRACAEEHGVDSCAYCPDYDCDTIRGYFQMNPALKEALDAMRG